MKTKKNIKNTILTILAILFTLFLISLYNNYKDNQRLEYATAHNCEWVVSGAHDICK